MTIDALPQNPSINDPDNFDPEADAWVAALNDWTTQANALAVAMNLNSTTDTSASSVAIGTGSKSFTVSTGKSFQPGMFLMIADTAAPSTNWMLGQITSYVTGTGALVVNVTDIGGSGTKTAWIISQSTAFTVTSNDAPTVSLASAATVNIGVAASVNIEITGSVAITAFDNVVEGITRRITFTGSLLYTYNATSLKLLGGQSRNISPGDVSFVRSLGGGNWVEEFFQPFFGYPMNTGARQIVLSGPYDSSGNSNYLPATATGLNLTSQNITASAPLIVSSFNGFNKTGAVDVIGYSASNLTWTGLTNNDENYLYVTIAAGVLTTGFTVLDPVIQPSGTPATTAGQITINTVDAKVYLGNGSTAPQTNLVVVGRATTSGGNVTATTIYQNGIADLSSPIFIANGTWYNAWKNTNYIVEVEMWGGGAGGYNGSNNGGGGGGAYNCRRFRASELGLTETVTVGVGGTVGVAGGTSSFGSWMSAFGGGPATTINSGSGGGGTKTAGTATAGGLGYSSKTAKTAGAEAVGDNGGAPGGGTGVDGGSADWGGGGGAGANNNGGNSTFGGAGGASTGTQGLSLYGGDGGAASVGQIPGGGGAANFSGARGEVRIRVIKCE